MVKNYRYEILDSENDLTTVNKIKKILTLYKQINDANLSLNEKLNFRVFNTDFIEILYNNLMKLQSKTNEIEIMTKKINDYISKYNKESENILNTVYEFNKDDDSEFITLRIPN